MTIQHTPGPWKAHKDNFTVTANHGIICKVATGENRDEEDANLALIAAAPDLLECLDNLLSLGSSEHFGEWEKWEEVIAAREAIAKAEGRDS